MKKITHLSYTFLFLASLGVCKATRNPDDLIVEVYEDHEAISKSTLIRCNELISNIKPDTSAHSSPAYIDNLYAISEIINNIQEFFNRNLGYLLFADWSINLTQYILFSQASKLQSAKQLQALYMHSLLLLGYQSNIKQPFLSLILEKVYAPYLPSSLGSQYQFVLDWALSLTPQIILSYLLRNAFFAPRPSLRERIIHPFSSHKGQATKYSSGFGLAYIGFSALYSGLATYSYYKRHVDLQRSDLALSKIRTKTIFKMLELPKESFAEQKETKASIATKLAWMASLFTIVTRQMLKESASA